MDFRSIDKIIAESEKVKSLRERKEEDFAYKSILREARNGNFVPTKKASTAYRNIAPIIKDSDWPELRESIIKMMLLEDQIFSPTFSLRESGNRGYLIEQYVKAIMFDGSERLLERKLVQREGESNEDYEIRERARKDRENKQRRDRNAARKAAGMSPSESAAPIDTAGSESTAPAGMSDQDAASNVAEFIHQANKRYGANFLNQFGKNNVHDNLTPQEMQGALHSIEMRSNEENDTQYSAKAAELRKQLDNERIKGKQNIVNAAVDPKEKKKIEKAINDVAASDAAKQAPAGPPPQPEELQALIADLEGEDERSKGRKLLQFLKRSGKTGLGALKNMLKAGAMGGLMGGAMGGIGGLIGGAGIAALPGAITGAMAGFGGAAAGAAPVAILMSKAQAQVDQALEIIGPNTAADEKLKQKYPELAQMIDYNRQKKNKVKNPGGLGGVFGGIFGRNKKQKEEKPGADSLFESIYSDSFMQTLREERKLDVVFKHLEAAKQAFTQSRSGLVKVLSLVLGLAGGYGGGKIGQKVAPVLMQKVTQLINGFKQNAPGATNMIDDAQKEAMRRAQHKKNFGPDGKPLPLSKSEYNPGGNKEYTMTPEQFAKANPNGAGLITGKRPGDTFTHTDNNGRTWNMQIDRNGNVKTYQPEGFGPAQLPGAQQGKIGTLGGPSGGVDGLGNSLQHNPNGTGGAPATTQSAAQTGGSPAPLGANQSVQAQSAAQPTAPVPPQAAAAVSNTTIPQATNGNLSLNSQLISNIKHSKQFEQYIAANPQLQLGTEVQANRAALQFARANPGTQLSPITAGGVPMSNIPWHQ